MQDLERETREIVFNFFSDIINEARDTANATEEMLAGLLTELNLPKKKADVIKRISKRDKTLTTFALLEALDSAIEFAYELYEDESETVRELLKDAKYNRRLRNLKKFLGGSRFECE